MALTAKQEKFCQGIAAGMNQADAYRAAYDAVRMKPATIQNNAYNLAVRNSEVAARITNLRNKVAAQVEKKLVYGVEQAMAEADEAIKLCKAKENGGAMVSAVTLKAKLNGLLIERKEIRTGPLDDMAVDQLQAMQQAIDAIRRARESA